MSILKLIYTFTLISGHCLAQDEKFIRDLLTLDFTTGKVQKGPDRDNAHWVVDSPLYSIDLNNDGFKDSLQISKVNGEDWFQVLDNNQRIAFQMKLAKQGRQSKLYKVSIKKIAEKTILMVLYFYEGFSLFTEFDSSGRLYFLTMENNNFATLKSYEGPRYWDEKERKIEHYHQRIYSVNVEDINSDGTKEVIFSYNLIKRVYFYRGEGNWNEI